VYVCANPCPYVRTYIYICTHLHISYRLKHVRTYVHQRGHMRPQKKKVISSAQPPIPSPPHTHTLTLPHPSLTHTLTCRENSSSQDPGAWQKKTKKKSGPPASTEQTSPAESMLAEQSLASSRYICIHRHRHRHTHTHTHTDTHTHAQTYTDSQTDRQTDTNTHTYIAHTHTHAAFFLPPAHFF
jgi:hypothetical protein